MKKKKGKIISWDFFSRKKSLNSWKDLSDLRVSKSHNYLPMHNGVNPSVSQPLLTFLWYSVYYGQNQIYLHSMENKSTFLPYRVKKHHSEMDT